MRHGPSGTDPRHGRHVPPPSACPSGKVAFKKQRQAKRDVDRMSRLANPKRRPHLRVYKCRLCPAWHITSQGELPDHMRAPRPVK